MSSDVAKTFLGRYELQKKLAVGGMAEIYLAHVTGVGGFQKQVVVKRILPQLAESEELFNMFLDEARIAATLHHPNVVQVYDACHEDGEYFMAMEYLDGTDLRTLRKVLADRAEPLPWEHSLHIVLSIAAGLHYAHDKRGYDDLPLGIVHRDVTPHNIFLTREGSVKLVDFGIAKAEGRTTETAMGTLKGKLAYMSPEQCVGDAVDRRSDIYSLGIILYELTTGKRLYKGSTEYQLIKEIVEGEIKRPSSFMEYPPDLEALVMRCLEKSPRARFQSARDVQSAVEAFAREYQLPLSSLNFSSFLEPLLEEAGIAAEERWKQRTETMPIRVLPGSNPARMPGDAAPATRTGDLPSLAALARHAASSPGDGDEPMTARVPEDMLARLREEERQLAISEQERNEADAIPRFAAGTTSSNVVRRASSLSSSPVPSVSTDDRFDADSGSAEDAQPIWETSIRASLEERARPAPRRQSSTMVVAPLGSPAVPELSDDDMRVTASVGGLWIAALLVLGASGGAAYLYSQRDAPTTASPVAVETRAEVGSLVVAGDSGAQVWMFLGRTPIQTLAINSESEHRIRLEHEGYHNDERTLGAATWLRDASGTQHADVKIELVPEGLAPPVPPESSGSPTDQRPASLRIQSSPDAANAWLFVGTTPNVKIGNLSTSQEVQLRIEREGKPPSFRVVHPDQFSADGETRIEVVTPPASAPAAAAAQEHVDASTISGTGSPNSNARRRP